MTPSGVFFWLFDPQLDLQHAMDRSRHRSTEYATGWPTAGASLSHPTVIALSVATPFLAGADVR